MAIGERAPTTEAGRRLADLAPRLWEQPRHPLGAYRPIQIEARELVRAIEAEARRAALDEAIEAVEGTRPFDRVGGVTTTPLVSLFRKRALVALQNLRDG